MHLTDYRGVHQCRDISIYVREDISYSTILEDCLLKFRDMIPVRDANIDLMKNSY